MRAFAAVLVISVLVSSSVWAIPNSFSTNGISPIPIIPAFPRFNAELTQEFLAEENWNSDEFSGPWEEEPSLPGLEIRSMSASPIVFGEIPMSVVSYSDEQGVVELAIHFLDAGIYFGYQYGGEQTREAREQGREKRNEFERSFKALSKSLTRRLEDGCGRGQEGVIGVSPALRTEFVDYRWENFVLRFVQREGHSVALHIYRSDRVLNSLVDSDLLEMSRREREARLAKQVRVDDLGAAEVIGLPMFTQGVTPFCSVHSLAMVSHYLGLNARPEILVAAADFKNTGSAGGSDLIEVHRAVAQELGMRVSLSPKFDADKVFRSIEEGVPVIVWRRVSESRERAHEAFSKHLAANPEASLVPLSNEELDKLPARDERGTPSHASIVTGIDLERGVAIYTEPWGEATRGRRMRVEEMEETVYAVFYFKL